MRSSLRAAGEAIHNAVLTKNWIASPAARNDGDMARNAGDMAHNDGFATTLIIPYLELKFTTNFYMKSLHLSCHIPGTRLDKQNQLW